LPLEQHDGEHHRLAGVGVAGFVQVDAVRDEVGWARRIREQRAGQQASVGGEAMFELEASVEFRVEVRGPLNGTLSWCLVVRFA
jgi:hypothetical protein